MICKTIWQSLSGEVEAVELYLRGLASHDWPSNFPFLPQEISIQKCQLERADLLLLPEHKFSFLLLPLFSLLWNHEPSMTEDRGLEDACVNMLGLKDVWEQPHFHNEFKQ